MKSFCFFTAFLRAFFLSAALAISISSLDLRLAFFLGVLTLVGLRVPNNFGCSLPL